MFGSVGDIGSRDICFSSILDDSKTQSMNLLNSTAMFFFFRNHDMICEQFHVGTSFFFISLFNRNYIY